eukprot:7359661-Prymnesium_polylepis.1
MVAPGGGVGRYARPAVPRLWPMVRREAVSSATRAQRCHVRHEIRVNEKKKKKKKNFACRPWRRLFSRSPRRW